MISVRVKNIAVGTVLFFGFASVARITEGQIVIPAPPVTALAFSPHGDLLAVGSQQGVTLLHWPSQRIAGHVAMPPSSVHAIVWDTDCLTVVGGIPGESGYAGLVQTQELESLLQPKEAESVPVVLELDDLKVRASDVIYNAAWSVDHQRIALASLDASVQIIDAKSRQTISNIEGHSSGVTGVCWLSDDVVASSSRDATLRLWSASQGSLIRTLNHHTDQTMGMVRAPLSDSPPVVASFGLDRTVRFWQPLIGRMMRFVRLDQTVGTAIAWCDGGKTLAVGTRNGHVLKIDAQQAKVFQEVTVSDDWIVSLACNPDGTVVCGTTTGEILVVEFR